MMIKTFNEEIIRQFSKSSFRAIVCLDFVLCPLFPRNTEVTEGRGRNKTQIHAWFVLLCFNLSFEKLNIFSFPLWPEYISSSSSSRSVNFRFQKTFPAKYTAQAHGIVTWANRMRATKTGAPCSKLCISLCSVSCAWCIGHIFACLGDDNEKCFCEMILQVLLFGGNNVWRPWGKSRRISLPLQPVGVSEGHP